MKKNAFTVIEMLVVIAIIAILAAIMIPVFAKAKDSQQRLNLVAPPQEQQVIVKSIVEDYVPGREPIQPGYKQPGYDGELFATVNTDQGIMLIYNKVRWQKRVCSRPAVQSQLVPKAVNTVLVGKNAKNETLIVGFVKAEEPEPEPDAKGTERNGSWSYSVER
jgi:prepilin-type N-terminal cleavage/methylation domain-containing protein